MERLQAVSNISTVQSRRLKKTEHEETDLNDANPGINAYYVLLLTFRLEVIEDSSLSQVIPLIKMRTASGVKRFFNIMCLG